MGATQPGTWSPIDVEKARRKLDYAKADVQDAGEQQQDQQPQVVSPRGRPAENSDATAAGTAGDSFVTTMKTVAAVTVWYSSSVGLVLQNKYLLTDFGFRQPVGLTLWHMVACSAMTTVLKYSGLIQVQEITSWRQFWKVAVLALVFCVSVVLGNISLKFIPVSFAEAIFATTPFFTALMALLMGMSETRSVYLTLIPIVVGIVISTKAEPSFHMVGFLAAVTATASRGLKAVLQGVLLSNPTEKLDSMNLLMYMTPIATIVLMLVVGIIEPDFAASLPRFHEPGAGRFYLIVGFNGFLAFFANLCNFLITRYTGALTLQVIGNLKGVLGVILSVWLFQNPWTWTSMLGYGICLMGAVLYMHAKRAQVRQASPNFNETLPRTTSISEVLANLLLAKPAKANPASSD